MRAAIKQILKNRRFLFVPKTIMNSSKRGFAKILHFRIKNLTQEFKHLLALNQRALTLNS